MSDKPCLGEAQESLNWPSRARILASDIAKSATRIEQTGRMPPDLLDRLHSLGAFRMLLPRSLGGDELDLARFAESIEELAKADASTAWCVGQASGCSFSAAYLDRAVATEIFGPPNAVVAWGPATRHSRAVAAEGGYRVTGSWMYASGSRHATWLGAQVAIFEADGTPRMNAAGRQIEKTMLFPRSAAQIEDVWQVMGLRGTGSDNYALTDHFIPERFCYVRDAAKDRRETGPLYRFGVLGVYGAAFSAVALGVARAAFDAFIELAAEKTPKSSAKVLRESGTIQHQVGVSEARLRAARAYLFQTLDELWTALSQGERLNISERLNLRMSVTHAIQESRQVVDVIYTAAGATAIFDKNPFERRFRDIHAVSQQIQGHSSNFETAGQVLLGIDGADPRI